MVVGLSRLGWLVKPDDAVDLSGFAAGAAVGHLSVSALAFYRVIRDHGKHSEPAEAATSDVVDMSLYVFGPARDAAQRNERSERAADIARRVVADRVGRLSIKAWLICWLLVAAAATVLGNAVQVRSTDVEMGAVPNPNEKQPK